ncbi:hypothetical protein Tco_0923780 [Tanacetum coccineum]|uniref:Uncharacterized protein n=1 Tax=Tanacetum coccineum TaxID=301880 RepID=A0ABQ5D5A2_9ASTR
MARTKSSRMITKDIISMTIEEYMEYEAEINRDPWGYAQSYTRSSGSTTLERSKDLENKHHPDKLKTNAYFPSLPPCIKPAQPLTKDTHEPLEKDPNEFNLSAPNSHHEDKEVSSDENVDEWLNAEMSKRITGQDKEEEEAALIDILKTLVEEYKSIYKKAQIKAPSSKTSLKDCGQCHTCNPDLSFCSGYDYIYGQEESGMLKQWICFRDHERQNVRGNGMIFANFFKVRYGNKNINDVTREWRYYEWVAQKYDFKVKSRRATEYSDPYDFHHEYPHSYIPQKSDSPSNDTLGINTYFPDVFQTQLKKLRLRDNSFEEWEKIKLGHTNISETIKFEMFKEWIKENFNFEVDFGRTRDDPYSKRFDVYKEEFDNEIEQLVNEYELKARRKRYALDKVWEKYEKFHDTTKLWYDKGFDEEELW